MADRSLTPDQGRALEGAAQRLRDEFGETFTASAVEDVLHSSYADLARNAKSAAFVALLAERFARQQLQAMTRLEGSGVVQPTVLFLCVHNAGRSQMALGWFTALAQGRAVAWSGGSEPGAEINPAAIEAMAEVGIDITQEYPKPWTKEIVKAADVVVTMGCGDTCPYYPGKRYEDWDLRRPRRARRRCSSADSRRDQGTIELLLDSLDLPSS